MTKQELSKRFKNYPDVLTVSEVSELLGVSTKLVYKLLKERAFPSIRIGREHKIAKINLIDYIRNGEKQKDKNFVSKIVWTVPIPCGMLVSGDSENCRQIKQKGRKAI
jgi:excisionase family DNA binding protein